jgi:ribosomal protein L40E
MSRDDDDQKAQDDEGRALEARVTAALKVGVPVLAILAATAAGTLYGASTAVLTLAAGTLLAGIVIFWASLRTLVGETPLSGADAYALGAPRAEEEQKRAVLRALKDLEFERSVGKISDEDYEALVARYRAEAKRLLRILDEDAGPEREKVEAMVRDRLAHEGLAGDADEDEDDDTDDDEDEAADEAPKKAEPKKPEPKKATPKKAEPKKPEPKKAAPKKTQPDEAEPAADAARSACAKCGTMNDADAVFCKKCGAKQGAEKADEEEGGEVGDRGDADEEGAS